MIKAISILAIWLTLLAQAGIGFAPQGAVVWLGCANAECPGVVLSADAEEACACCQGREREREDPTHPSTHETAGGFAACCVTLVFPGGRGQPPAPGRTEARASVTDAFASATTALPVAPPAWCAAIRPAPLACGQPPPRGASPPLLCTDRTITSRYRL